MQKRALILTDDTSTISADGLETRIPEQFFAGNFIEVKYFTQRISEVIDVDLFILTKQGVLKSTNKVSKTLIKGFLDSKREYGLTIIEKTKAELSVLFSQYGVIICILPMNCVFTFFEDQIYDSLCDKHIIVVGSKSARDLFSNTYGDVAEVHTFKRVATARIGKKNQERIMRKVGDILHSL